MVEVMRREADRERAIRNADRLADKSSATPSEAFPWFSRRFLLLAGVDDEMDLPKIYHELASAKKAEARQCVSEIINARTLEPDSAGVSEVKVTKELFEMIKQGNLGSELEIDDLTKGVQPFTCGYGMGPASDVVSARIDAFDLTMAGEIRPSMVEELTFKTKEIVLPEEPFLFQYMLQATSVVIDVVQGETHPHAIELRRFVITDIPRIIQNLVRLNSSGAGTGNVYPRLLREVQVRMNAYFSDLLQNLEPEPPTYTDIRRVIQTRQFGQLAPIPARYQSEAEMAPERLREGTATSGGGTPGTPSEYDMGQPVLNSQPTKREWMTKFEESGKTVTALRRHAPKGPNGQELCISYHMKGKCFSSCGRKASHKVLTGPSKSNFQTFVDTYVCEPVAAAGRPNSGTAGATSASQQE
jgi:hypothetical protein